ncbi:MAG TPA: hypothetical protein VH374_13340 [Polyangia bacterium]|jgi:hypothetical protein|nr:hypothetical protein [Polyangia bacterium]
MMVAQTNGDSLLELLGLRPEDPPLRAALDGLARGMEPELDPDDEEVLVDWVTVNEIGLEFGFEDEAYVRALDPALRRQAPPILSQLYFYGDTPKTHPFPYPLPFGLTFADDRATVRHKMIAYEDTRRSYVRDAWRLPKFDVTIAYVQATDRLESIYCHIPYTPWPDLPGEPELVAPFTPEAFADLFGRRWSDTELRVRLAPLGYDKALPEIRSEHVADLGTAHGLELTFAPGVQVTASDKRYPKTLVFAGATFYASRELDARQWGGVLPEGLSFSDTQTELRAKMGKTKPLEKEDEVLSGHAAWRFERYTVSVLYSNLENRILRLTLLAPGFYEALSAPDDDDE